MKIARGDDGEFLVYSCDTNVW